MASLSLVLPHILDSSTEIELVGNMCDGAFQLKTSFCSLTYSNQFRISSKRFFASFTVSSSSFNHSFTAGFVVRLFSAFFSIASTNKIVAVSFFTSNPSSDLLRRMKSMMLREAKRSNNTCKEAERKALPTTAVAMFMQVRLKQA
ncbi:hypothetical protein CRG98_049940 [Punica granatum]|uniref:Uncharacterized protein n=1 Tax=Punica granatum TaxID=22663 RepID=A0A2I0H1H6_PUNGR|nr:hypothetical protein CRG98_049940 [Punica granatum]